MSNKSVPSKDVTMSGGEVFKSSQDKRIIGGWFSVFKLDNGIVTDLDNEEVDIQSYENSFIEFSKNSRTANFEHSGPAVGDLIDNIFIGNEDFAKMLVHEITGMDKDEITIKRLGHFGSFQLDTQENFEKAKASKSMFSIEGKAERVEIDE